MPEEKEKKEATPVTNKKASFTFSDKIKNSKPASSKSFAKRTSSKIGSDGKPRQTLFERTKRDVPFFIAALVALLLLPFLYKYSGNVEEEPAMFTPGYEDSAFNPERSGFDGFAGDPENQIAQLSGRDSMSLIRPLGGASTEEESDEEDYLSSRSAFAGAGSSEAHRLDEQDEEENTTNIYKYRKKAPAATRAAFKRTATKINRLGRETRPSLGGSRLGVGPWGGTMKAAANKVRSSSPKNAPKPVSLQPLQAAGKPSRSYFGNGASQEARRSKDAMSKGNAMQALMDAQARPVEPGKIGGIFGGEFTGGGPGSDLKRELTFQPKEPWWWDMMKQKAMMEWQKNLEWKWGIYNWLTQLAEKFLDPFLSCLLTGTDDWSMDHFLGHGGEPIEETCCGWKAKDLDQDALKAAGSVKAYCNKFNKAELKKRGADCSKGYKPGSAGTSGRLNAMQTRLGCLGVHFRGSRDKSQDGKVQETDNCNTFYTRGIYTSEVGGKRDKYTLYNYVVGVPYNDIPNFFGTNDAEKRKSLLQVMYLKKGSTLVLDDQELQQELNNKKFMPLFVESLAIKNRKEGKSTSKAKADPYSFLNDKKPLKYNDFINKLARGSGGIVIEGKILNKDGEEKDGTLLSTKGSKEGVSWSTGGRCAYPWAFVSCHNHALNVVKQNASGIEQGTTVESEKAWGTPAAFIHLPNLTGNEKNKEGLSEATLNQIKNHFTVMYEIQGEEGEKNEVLSADHLNTNIGSGSQLYFANIHSSAEGYPAPAEGVLTDDYGTALSSGTARYLVKVSGVAEQQLKTMLGVNKDDNKMPDGSAAKRAVVTWTVQQDWNEEKPWAIGNSLAYGHLSDGGRVSGGYGAAGKIVSTATCVYYDEGGYSYTVPDKGCPNPQKSKECCLEFIRKYPEYYKGWQWRDNPEPRCYKPENNTPIPETPRRTPDSKTRLAPVLSWVPTGPLQRDPMENQIKEKFKARLLREAQKEQREYCGEQTPIMMDSNAAKEFVLKVVEAYNNTDPEVKIDPTFYAGAFPTDGEFVDALKIAATTEQLGITKVPASAVCELGRDMVRMSRDPHTEEMVIENPIPTPYTDDRQKGNNTVFHNDLGAFLAYIHVNSVLYPQTYLGVNKEQCDYRFRVLGRERCLPKVNWGKKTCQYGSGIRCKEYNDTNYNDDSRLALNAFKRSLVKLEIGEEYPIKGLAAGKFPQSPTAGKASREKYRDTVQGLLGEKSDFSPWKGNACKAFYGDTDGPMIDINDALKYVKSVCDYGLDRKPYGDKGGQTKNTRKNVGRSISTSNVQGGQ